ncbi:MAG: DUF6261 family protein [Mediterranea sp.]|jgi:hypothetical protein|nr:DUF6261 family protein [Mediterranea sp.]
MGEISHISLQRLNNGAHFTFHTNVLNAIKSHTKVAKKVASMLQVYQSAFKAEDEALAISTKSFLTDEIQQADDKRDALYTGLKNSIKAFSNIPNEKTQQACKVLTQLLKDYRIDTKDQLEKETGLLINLVDDLQGKYRAEVSLLSLGDLVKSLRDANERVRIALEQRNASNSTKRLGALKKARQASDQAYGQIVKFLNAYALVEETTDYDLFIGQLNSLIVRYKREVIGQKVSAGEGGNGGTPYFPGGDSGGSEIPEAPEPMV